MYLAHLFKTNPMAAVALLFTLATLGWCLRLLPRQKTRVDRMLMTMLGFMAVYSGLRILWDNGFVSSTPSLQGIHAAADAAVAALYFAGALIIQISNSDKMKLRIHLRIAEAEQSQPMAIRYPAVEEDSPVAILATNVNGEICHWSGSAEALLGWQSEDVYGTRLPFGGDRTPITTEPRSNDLKRFRTKGGNDVLLPVWLLPLEGTGLGDRGALILVLQPVIQPAQEQVPQLRPAIV